MPDTSNLSETKRALLEQMLRVKLPQTQKAARAIPPRSQDGPVPLSFIQEQMWLLSHMISNAPIYNDCYSFHLPGLLNVDALEQSLNELIRRHEILRTSFPLLGAQPVQLIHPFSPVPMPVIDLREYPEQEREAEAIRLGREDVRQLFDLAQGPLMRLKLVRIEDEEYRLFWTMHHIINDGVSAYQVLFPELIALYQAFSQGQPSPLPAPSLQYADYAVWQREQKQDDKLEDLLAFWKQQLAGAPKLELPTDHPRPQRISTNGSLLVFALPKHLSAGLKELSQREGITLYITLLAAFKTLLYRYTGQEDMVIGTVTAGRRQPETQKMVGCFLNSFLLRADLSGAPSFRTLLKRVREAALGALEHDEMPFDHLVQKLQPERNLTQNPLFQVMMVLEPELPPLPPGWTVSQMEITAGAAKFDLVLELDDRPDEGIIGRFEYSTDLFEAATIERLFGHWQTLLESIVADPDQSITTLPILTPAERQQVIFDWNDNEQPYPDDQCFHQLVEAQAARTPDALAVVTTHQRLTYRQLNERANQLAHYLRALGVGPEVLVGLYLERSVDMLVAVLGIQKAGGAYVPIDPAFPSDRITYILEDSQALALVTQTSLANNLPDHQTQTICLDRDWPAIAEHSTTNPDSGVTVENLAYMIYTSGSTGKPKGVLVPHRGLPNVAEMLRRTFNAGPTSHILQVASISFDASMWDLLMALPHGGRLCIATDEERIPGPTLLQFLQDQAITIATLTPSTLAAMPDADLPALQMLISAAEACTPDLVAKWSKGRRFFNGYGPTETTIAATLVECSDTGSLPPIGRAFMNMQAYVLDKHLQPVPIGIGGELCIGGAGVARGYHHRPDLTAEKFIPHPFNQTPGARLYRTGDLVRWRADGNLEYLGRIDQQVKIRGFRIELGEIETTLLQHPAVREAVVLAREDTPGDKRLVAYLVPTNEEPLTSASLNSFLKAVLPPYMIPAAFVVLEAIPLNTSGKVDRRALPPPEETRLQPEETDLVAPRTPTEEGLAAIWMDLLGLQQVGVHSNFFELGGHSLLALRVISRIHSHFQVQLPLSSLFEGPTIADLALRIVQHQAEQADNDMLDQLLAELEQTSDAEIQSLLAIKQQEG